MKSITNSAKFLSIAFAALILLTAPVAFVHADEGGDYGVWDMGGGDSYGAYPTSYTDSYPANYDSSYGSYGAYPTSYTDSYPADYSSGYGGYSPSSYGSGYSSGGGFYTPSVSGGYYLPSSSGSSNVYAPTNNNIYVPTNTCVGGNNCNTNFVDNSVYSAPTTVVTDSHNIVTNPAPVIINQAAPTYPAYQPVYQPTYQQPPVYTQPPVYNSCNYCGCPGYAACSRPIAQQPYVTLAAVPYTGLELGPVGTALYWGFLVLWCLLAAYLIVVKKVQNKLAAWFTGKKAATTQVVATHAPVAYSAPVLKVTAPHYAGIDPFIVSQISRAY